MQPNGEGFDHNLIPEDKLGILRIKVNKSHRKESDWEAIKDILNAYCLVTAEPMARIPGVRAIDHVLCRNEALVVFTNVSDCQEYAKMITKTVGHKGRFFMIGSIGFYDVVDIANRERLDIYIDPKNEKNHSFIRYKWDEKKLAVSMF